MLFSISKFTDLLQSEKTHLGPLKIVLLSANPRSGSSFLSAVFAPSNNNFTSFFSFEPLVIRDHVKYHVTYGKRRRKQYLDKLEVITNFLNCDFSGNYMKQFLRNYYYARMFVFKHLNGTQHKRNVKKQLYHECNSAQI